MPTCCILDGNKDKTFICKTHFAGHTFKVCKCTKCGLAYLDINDQAIGNILDTYYKGEYQNTYHTKTGFGCAIREWISRAIGFYYAQPDYLLQFLKSKKIIDHHSLILDIGCGTGVFIVWLDKKKYPVVGFEPDPNRARIAREHIKRGTIIVGDVDDAIKLNTDFTLISMLQVVEHFARPDLILKEVKKEYPRSKMMIIVPNCQNQKVFIRGLIEPHIFHFTPKTIKQLIIKSGWEVECIKTITERKGYIWLFLWWFLGKQICIEEENGEDILVIAK